MKNLTNQLLFVFLLLPFGAFAQTGVSINSTGAAPDAQTILDINSKTKGVQLPRLTTSEASTLAGTLDAGDDGMIIYDTNLKAFKYWDGSLLQWVQVGTDTGGANTLDDAYDGGGSGLGRTITADAGNVELEGSGFLTVESNVGIGTTAPAEKLEVQFSGRGGILIGGDNTQDVFIQMTNDVAGSNYMYTDQSDGNFLKLESGSGKDIEFLTDGANERMAVQSDGRVRVNNLADPNSAVVISNPAGVLGKAPLTGNSTDVLLGTGFFGPASDFADDDWYQTLSTNTPTGINDWIYTNGRVGIGVGASTNPSAPLQVAASGFGNPDGNSILAANSINSAGNDAIIATRVAGSSAGDPFFSMDISGEAGWSVGVDNDHGNRFKIAPSWNNLSSGTAMTVLTNGNVGIGTTDPDQKLQVQGVARSRGSYMIDVDGANGSGPRIAWGTTADVYAMMNLGAYGGINNLETTNRDFRLGSNAAFNAFYLQNGSGNIGVSTNSPNYRLTVQGSNSEPMPVLGLQSGNNTLDFNNGAQIAFGYNGTDDFQHFIHTRHNSSNSNNAIDFYVSNGTQNNSITSGSTHTMSLVSGNVGVGTTSPAQKLHVVGSGRISSLSGAGNRVVYANANGDLITSSSNANPNSLIDGSGTVNYLARWTPDGNTLGIGTTYDNGTNVGIGTASPAERLHINTGNLRVGGTGINSGADNLKMMYGGGRANDTSYEWVGFYSGTTRQGIILYDGAWTGANNSTDEFSITAENGNKLTLNTNTDHIGLMPGGSSNVGIGTITPAAKLEVDGGANTELRVKSDDNGASTISVYGNSQGTGRLYVGQSTTYGGGIEYNGDNSPVTVGAGADYVTLFRRNNGTDEWTARNRYFNNDWEFREDVDVNGYLTVGNPNTGSTVKKGSKTFVHGTAINIWNGTGNYNYNWNAGQLDLPPGAASVTVKSISYNMTGYRRDTDESIGIYAQIGGNTSGWTLTSGWTFGGGGDQYYDWNFAQDLNWTFNSSQTVQFRMVEENETCFFCNNDYFTLYNIEVTVHYEYTTSPQAGTILAEGRIYANSTLEMGDMAEYFDVVDEDVQVGHLVSLIPGSENEYRLSEKGYDPYILGVVSENPSVVLNSPDVGPPVALAGRVNVKLVPGMPLVKSGDFITSSPQRGLAMKARKPGTVIGYAVENQALGQGYVEILLQPGRFYYPAFDNESDELPRQKFSSGK